MLKGIIFDFDGVLVDSHPAHKLAWRKLLQELGQHIAEDDLAIVSEGLKKKEILRHFLGDLSGEQIQRYGERKDELFQASISSVRIVAGVNSLLHEASRAGIKMAVASSASRSRVMLMMRELRLLQFFDEVVAAEDVLSGKPDPEVFLRAASLLRIHRASILACEDAIYGVQAAKAAGMKCLGIASEGREESLAKAGADKIVSDFNSVTLPDLQALFS